MIHYYSIFSSYIILKIFFWICICGMIWQYMIFFWLNILSSNNKYYQPSIMLWKLIKRQVNIKICWSSFCWRTFCWNSFCHVYNFLAKFHSPIKLSKYLLFLQLHVAGNSIHVTNSIFFNKWCSFGFLHGYQYLLLFHIWFELHLLPWNFHLHSHDLYLVNVFDSFIHVIMLKKHGFKSSVLFGIYTLLDKSCNS